MTLDIYRDISNIKKYVEFDGIAFILSFLNDWTVFCFPLTFHSHFDITCFHYPAIALGLRDLAYLVFPPLLGWALGIF